MEMTPEIAAKVEAFYADPNFDFETGATMWRNLEHEQAVFTKLEMLARKAIYKRAFPNFKTGVQSYELSAGWLLKGTGKINYRLDKELFPQVRADLAKQNLSLDDYLRVSYALAEGAYNKILQDEQKNKTVGPVLRTMITSNEGAPTLEIVKPKR